MSHLAACKRIHSPQSKSDDFFTPLSLLEPLHREFRFTLDVASHPLAPSNALIGRALCWPEADGLAESWAGERVWLNPPYSNIAPWVEKATREVAAGCELVAMLLPANKTEQPWWQRLVEPHRDRGGALTTRFVPKRLRHGCPEDPLGAHATAGTFGSVLLIWRAR